MCITLERGDGGGVGGEAGLVGTVECGFNMQF